MLQYINHPDPGVQKAARELCRRLNVPADLQLDQTLADAADAGIPRSLAALQHLAALRPDEASRAKVSEALNAFLLDPHPEIRADALNAVKVWGTRANTAALLKLMGDYRGPEGDIEVRVIDLLGSLKDPKAAPQLAKELTQARERGPAGQALVSIGPASEEAVLPFLQGADTEAGIEACWVLANIGTTRSLQPLQDAISMAPDGPPGGVLIWEVQLAIQKIGRESDRAGRSPTGRRVSRPVRAATLDKAELHQPETRANDFVRISRSRRAGNVSRCTGPSGGGKMPHKEGVVIMIELTEEQRHELNAPEPVAIDPRTKETYVLVRLEKYERMKDLLYDAGPWTDEEMDLLAAEDADRLGWEGMEAYQGEGA